MSKTLVGLQNFVIRRARIDIGDTTSIGAIIEDLNDAIDIIASEKNWDELYSTKNLFLTKTDGDIVYALDATVDKVDQVRITSPVTYARPITYIQRRELLDVLGAKTNNGKTTPSLWYFAEPTLSTSNVETKNISFNTQPDQAYTVSYTFRSLPPQLIDAVDYPFFNANYHYILGDYAIWRYAERNPDTFMNPDSFERKWTIGLSELLKAYDTKVTVNAPIPGPKLSR